MTTPLQQAAQALIEQHLPTYLDQHIAELRKALDAEMAMTVEPVAWILEEVDEWKTSDHSQGRACTLFTDLHELLSYKELLFLTVVSVTPLAQVPVAGRYRQVNRGIRDEWYVTDLSFALDKMSLQKSNHVILPHGGTYEVELLYPPHQGDTK